MDIKAMEENFNSKLAELAKRHNSTIISDDKYRELLDEVKEAKTIARKMTLHYRRLKRYDTIILKGREYLIKPVKSSEEPLVFFVPQKDVFDTIHQAHVECSHGGRDRTVHMVAKKSANITREQVAAYLELCEHCLERKPHLKKGSNGKPTVSEELNNSGQVVLNIKSMTFEEERSRGQVGLIDLESCPVMDYNFIMNYQDQSTKFCILKPLKSKNFKEVATNLVDIFSFLGAPSILHSDTSREFCSSVIASVKDLWPSLAILLGNPRNSQSVKRANHDIENILFTWLDENQTDNWVRGLPFCQFVKNNTYHTGIKKSPFEAMFGKKSQLGLDLIPESLRCTLVTEEDLDKITTPDTSHSPEDMSTITEGVNGCEVPVPHPNTSTEHIVCEPDCQTFTQHS